MSITIDSNHVYRNAGGRIVPGVTSIIRSAGLMGDTSYFTDFARDRGTAVHLAIELLEQDDLDRSSLDDVTSPYVEAWERFKSEAGYVSEKQELKIHNKTYNYAGTADQVGNIGKDTVLIDIKTGVYQKWWALQCAAYNEVTKCKRRLSVELKNDGSYRMTEHTDKLDFQRFLACLTVHNIKKSWGLE